MGGVAAKSGNRAGRSLVGRRLGRYEVLAKIASGGMAAVYVARAQGVAGFERLVAIKILHSNLAHEEEFVRMFLDEARLAARIRHPNVVPTLDISDTIDAGYFIVMEYIEGDHLGQLLAGATKLKERLPQPAVMRIMVDGLSGLGAAHKLADEKGKPLNLVHRDVSPHNIMVGLDGISRLTDFGVAKAEDRLTHTRDGQIKGKLSYMAPEQASVGRTDPRSDLFSIGIILWEALTGVRLFRSETTAGTLNKLVSEPIPMPSSVDPALEVFDPLLRKALSRDPEVRFQTADEFSEALETLAKQVGGLASLREVGKAVEKFAAERIAADKQRIKEAIQTFGSVEYAVAARPPGADDLISEPSGGAWTGSSASPVSRSGPSGANSAVSKMSGVYPHGTSPSVLRAGVPLRPPPPPRRSVARNEEVIPLTDADMEPSEPSVMSASQIGAAPSSFGKWLAVLAVCCVILAGVALWAMLKEPESEVRVIQMEVESEPSPPAPVPEIKPPEPVEPPLAEPDEEEVEEAQAEEVSVEKPPQPSPKIEKPPRWRKPPVRKAPEPAKPAAAAPEPKKPEPLIPEDMLKPSAVEEPPKVEPAKKPLVIDELDPDNPYR